MSCLAISLVAFFALLLALTQSVPPSLDSLAFCVPSGFSPPPMNLLTESSWVAGTYNVSAPA